MLWLVARSVGATLSVPGLLVSYTVGTALAIISISPSGIGIVEPAMLRSLTRYGAQAGSAAATVALYRLVGLWLPFLAGLFSVVAQRRREA